MTIFGQGIIHLLPSGLCREATTPIHPIGLGDAPSHAQPSALEFRQIMLTASAEARGLYTWRYLMRQYALTALPPVGNLTLP
ncbi:MAG: hypothetical protein M0R66_05825 [Candidatus Omnitrophica bacterium]|nr:hypothetical protein [Candidatus Omnitrophota bacterium]